MLTFVNYKYIKSITNLKLEYYKKYWGRYYSEKKQIFESSCSWNFINAVVYHNTTSNIKSVDNK